MHRGSVARTKVATTSFASASSLASTSLATAGAAARGEGVARAGRAVRRRAAVVHWLERPGRRLARPHARLGRCVGIGRHALANGDHVRAVLAADLEDLAANPVIADRVPGIATVAEKLHAVLRPPGQ
ncbi:MAG TPA: hypothetical protein VK601_28045 [Kofleriaceae bacterium]|nr:hypothetical protein [Kofleriaceae bacterium]